MKKKIKFTKFDPVDELRSERAFEVYITALRDDGAPEWLIEDARKDVERARVVHGIPKAVATSTLDVAAQHAVSVA